jgi:hypothetical protein
MEQASGADTAHGCSELQAQQSAISSATTLATGRILVVRGQAEDAELGLTGNVIE